MLNDGEFKSQTEEGRINIRWKCPNCGLIRVLRKRDNWYNKYYQNNPSYQEKKKLNTNKKYIKKKKLEK